MTTEEAARCTFPVFDVVLPVPGPRVALQFPDNAGGEALRAALERHGLLAAALQRPGRPCAFRRIVARPRRLHWALLPFARGDRDLAAAPRGGAPSGFAAAPPPPGERARFHALALSLEVCPRARPRPPLSPLPPVLTGHVSSLFPY